MFSTRESAGQSLVELALTIPLLLVILLGVIDLGRLYSAYTSITNAAREGARSGSLDPTNSTRITNRVNQEAPNLTGLSVTIKCAPYANNPPYSYSAANCSSAQPGDRIQVSVNYTFQFITLYLFGIPNLDLSNNTAMAIIETN